MLLLLYVTVNIKFNGHQTINVFVKVYCPDVEWQNYFSELKCISIFLMLQVILGLLNLYIVEMFILDYSEAVMRGEKSLLSLGTENR